MSFAVALTRYQLLEVYPVPRNQIINHIDSGVVLTDASDRIVDINLTVGTTPAGFFIADDGGARFDIRT